MKTDINHKLKALDRDLSGEIRMDHLHKMVYATDASIYRQLPSAVAFPKNEHDLQRLVLFCAEEQLPLIPRAAGTSLAGQVVGQGLICDTSRYFTKIIQVNEEDRTVTLQPGVVRDVLNQRLKSKGLFFGPNTSTSNRCNLGGMIGNNSAGTTSVMYGSTRDKVIDLRIVTTDARVNHIGPGDIQEHSFDGPVLERVKKHIFSTYKNRSTREMVIEAFPKPEIHRRNTGYALDDLCHSQPFEPSGRPFNLARLLCGSEGTLALTTEATIQLDVLPPPRYAIVTMEFSSVHRALLNVKPTMGFQPYQCELMDDVILGCTEHQPKYKPYRALIKGDPRAVLMVELRAQTSKELAEQCLIFKDEMEKLGLAEIIQIHDEADSDKLWELRKAGLGLLANLRSKGVAVACIEDTAVSLDDLPEYIDEFERLMKHHGQKAVYYAHAGAGELHLRPILDLKNAEGREELLDICRDSADLVKKYNGSLSGEHGDGRVRAPFIKDMVGPEVYRLMEEMKGAWDPDNLFNPGKIVDPLPIDRDLRYKRTPERRSFYRFTLENGVSGMAEKCNGSGDCRKPHEAGGTMCPSYHATRNEIDTTRARANALREVLLSDPSETAWQDPALAEVLDLCISCKGCQKECPSNVDMSLMKSEYQYQFYRSQRRPIRDILFSKLPDFGLKLPNMTRAAMWVADNLLAWTKPLLGLEKGRPLPRISSAPLSRMARRYRWQPERITDRTIVLLCDEFTNLFEPQAGLKALHLFEALGYHPMLSPPIDSCRALFSKGFLEKARRKVDRQIEFLRPAVERGARITGLEPSATLGVHDEWMKVCSEATVIACRELASRTLTIEELLLSMVRNGELTPDHFISRPDHYHVHGHCHFKAQVEESILYELLGVLPGSMVHRIPSGCCGMAGSFGYEKEHFEISRSIGELTLFPYLRKIGPNDIIIANGISCRHQIHDLLGMDSLHPVEILYDRIKHDHNNDR